MVRSDSAYVTHGLEQSLSILGLTELRVKGSLRVVLLQILGHVEWQKTRFTSLSGKSYLRSFLVNFHVG
jgi:hypothetical protein